MQGQFSLVDEKYASGQLNWDGLILNKKGQVNFELGAVSFDFEQEVVLGELYAGTSISEGSGVFRLSSIKAMEDTGIESLNISNLAVSASSVIKDNFAEISVNYHIDEMKAAQQSFKQFNLDLLLSHFSVDVLQELNEALSKLPQGGTPEENQAHLLTLLPIAAKLIEQDALIEVTDFSVETDSGKISSDMQVSIDKQLFDTTNVMSIMTALKAEAKMNGPETFFQAQGLAPMINAYVDQGLLVRAKDQLSVEANFVQGKLTVNGKELAL